MEHVQPIGGLIRTLLDTPRERPEFIRTLNAALQFCVVTTAEDKMLAAPKVLRAVMRRFSMNGAF